MTDKRFDGCLICTDIDGTLTDRFGGLSEENAKAINFFQQRGGLFTVATGRYADYILKYKELFVPNTCVVALNGAVVADCFTGEEKWFSAMPEGSADDVKRIFNGCEQLERVYFNMQHGCPEFTRDEIDKISAAGVSDDNRLYKLVFTSSEAITARTRDYFMQLAENRYLCEQSWQFGIELYSRGAGKRNAVEWLKNHVGAQKLVCIGDYENDIGMIKLANLGVAVANAHESVRGAADVVTVSNDESAIAKLIDML